MAGHDPPRRPAGLRLRTGHGAPRLRDPAQELRRRLHRHGLQAHGQRRLPGLAGCRAGGDGRRAAVEILHRRATPEERADFEADYAARLLNPYVAAERGYVDAVIDPADTRAEIARALEHAVEPSASGSSRASTTTRPSDGGLRPLTAGSSSLALPSAPGWTVPPPLPANLVSGTQTERGQHLLCLKRPAAASAGGTEREVEHAGGQGGQHSLRGG